MDSRKTNSLMICGWRRTLRYWISRLTLGVMSMLTIFLRLMIFMATLWPVSEWTATGERCKRSKGISKVDEVSELLGSWHVLRLLEID